MANARSSALFNRLERLLSAERGHADEPALKPIMIARHMLRGAVTLDAPVETEAVLRRFRRSVFDYHMERVDDFGWLRVPMPTVEEMARWIRQYIKDAKAFGRRVLAARQTRPVALELAKWVREAWPVIGYFVLQLLIDDALREEPFAMLYETKLVWLEVGEKRRPHIVRIEPQTEDIFTRMWFEAAVLLTAEAPSEVVREMLRTKVSEFTRGQLDLGAELFTNVHPLVQTRLPTGAPFQAIEYLNQALRNGASRELTLRGAPAGTKLSTLRAYRRAGLSKDASAEDIKDFERKQAAKRAHHIEGSMTKRQASRALRVSLRAVESALGAAEKQLGARPRDENGVLRLDQTWIEVVRANLPPKKRL